MTDRKLVSVITGTYDRPYSLDCAIANIKRQTYPNIEHVIVHDGPASEDVLGTIKKHLYGEDNAFVEVSGGGHRYGLKFYQTGRQWSHFLASSISAVPYQVAQWMASGDYLCWFADDETMDPEHIEKLVNLLEERQVDFVYSKTECWFADIIPGLRPPNVIGEDPPRSGRITHALYRVELLDYRGFEPHVGSGTDWDQVDHWMKAGASWAFLPEVTHTHRVDKMGDAGLNNERQKLYGQAK